MEPALENECSGDAEIRAALAEFLSDGVSDGRSAKRQPRFGPVKLFRPVGDQRYVSAFARDLSMEGIGLIHLVPLEPGQILMPLVLPSGRQIVLIVELLWCRDYGSGWYASGGRFLGVL
jgi:hypothetical protein